MSNARETIPENVWVCFAVKQESVPFTRLRSPANKTRVLVTGMGIRNARLQVLEALNTGPLPALVISSGFAGGLKPGIPRGAVLFEAGERFRWEQDLKKAGGIPASFHCASKVVVTSRQKAELRQRTGADAVDMESLGILEVCRQRRIPSVIVRVVLDSAEEDLPLDFGALLDSTERIDPMRLALALAKSPGKIPSLLRFGRQSAEAARILAAVLRKFLATG